MSQAARTRREQVLAALLEQQRVEVNELAGRLGVSDATVRRDLKALADERQAELVHGGARLPRDTDFSLQAKQRRNADAKAVIAHLAAGLVRDGEQLFLDSGSTSLALAQQLAARRGLCVIANSVRLAGELKAAELILIGGRYRPERQDAVGPLAEAALGELRGYACFLGADGLAMDAGPSASDAESAHLHRLAVEHARETTLLVDHSKFAAPSLFRIVSWERITRVVTDRAPDSAWAAFLAERGIDLIHPDASEP